MLCVVSVVIAMIICAYIRVHNKLLTTLDFNGIFFMFPFSKLVFLQIGLMCIHNSIFNLCGLNQRLFFNFVM
jgi:hypothetical protein